MLFYVGIISLIELLVGIILNQLYNVDNICDRRYGGVWIEWVVVIGWSYIVIFSGLSIFDGGDIEYGMISWGCRGLVNE